MKMKWLLLVLALSLIITAKSFAIEGYPLAREWRITSLSSTSLKPGAVVTIRGHFPLNGSDIIGSHDLVLPIVFWGNNTLDNSSKMLEVMNADEFSYKVKIPNGIKPQSCKLLLVKFRYPQLATNQVVVRILPADKPDIVIEDIAFGYHGKKKWLGNNHQVSLSKGEYARSRDGQLLYEVWVKIRERNYRGTGKFRARFRWVSPKKYPRWNTSAVVNNISLGPGKTTVIHARLRTGFNHWRPEYANCSILAAFNDDKKQVETDYTNNRKEFNVSFNNFAACDLVLSKIRRETKHPKAGKPVVLAFVIQNKGDITSRPCKYYVFLGGASHPRVLNLGPIRPGKGVTKRTRKVFNVKQKYRVTCQLNPDRSVDEYRTDNNSKSIEFNVN